MTHSDTITHSSSIAILACLSTFTPQPIIFLEFRLDYRNFRMMCRLAEFTRKVENSANLRLNV